MKWEILILTMPERCWILNRLLTMLRPQVDKYPDVEILVHEHDPNISLGQNREVLRQKSSAEYVNFVDDDDLVAEDYVAKIYPLLDGVDFVGFQAAVYRNGVYEPTLRTSISLRHKTWSNDDKGYYCDISHLGPMRRELALKVPMEGGRGEDARWAAALRNLQIVSTEHYVPEVMYHYYT
jgi:hypothetical protein